MLDKIMNELKDAAREVQEDVREHIAKNTALRADILNYPDRYVVMCEVSGLSRDDITIEVDENELSIKAKMPDPLEDVPYLVKERAIGEVEREWKLPNVADNAPITAKMENGILTITVPKVEQKNTKRVVDIAE
jgi:HSP20 family protein